MGFVIGAAYEKLIIYSQSGDAKHMVPVNGCGVEGEECYNCFRGR